MGASSPAWRPRSSCCPQSLWADSCCESHVPASHSVPWSHTPGLLRHHQPDCQLPLTTLFPETPSHTPSTSALGATHLFLLSSQLNESSPPESPLPSKSCPHSVLTPWGGACPSQCESYEDSLVAAMSPVPSAQGWAQNGYSVSAEWKTEVSSRARLSEPHIRMHGAAPRGRGAHSLHGGTAGTPTQPLPPG